MNTLVNKYVRYLWGVIIVLLSFAFCFRLVIGDYSSMMFGEVFFILYFSFRLRTTKNKN
jgi:hypothetical protein